MRVKYLTTILLFFLFIESSDAQIMYRTRYRGAFMFESFGVSPIASANYEYLPIRWRNSFLSTRIGLGIVPGGGQTTHSFVTNAGGFSLPTSVTYNYILNNLKKGINRRVSLRCKSAPSKVASEWFAETGLGYSMTASRTADVRHYNFGVIALRQQVIFDIPPHPRVFWMRGALTPAYVESKFEFRGGFSLGVSL